MPLSPCFKKQTRDHTTAGLHKNSAVFCRAFIWLAQLLCIRYRLRKIRTQRGVLHHISFNQAKHIREERQSAGDDLTGHGELGRNQNFKIKQETPNTDIQTLNTTGPWHSVIVTAHNSLRTLGMNFSAASAVCCCFCFSGAQMRRGGDCVGCCITYSVRQRDQTVISRHMPSGNVLARALRVCNPVGKKMHFDARCKWVYIQINWW